MADPSRNSRFSRMSDVLIHIGLPKAASTSLQAVMSGHPLIYSLGKTSGRYVEKEFDEFFRNDLVFAPDIVYRDDDARRLLQPHLRRAEENSQLVWLSDELFSGIGFRRHRTLAALNSYDSVTILSRLQRLFDDPAFLVVIREQRNFLWSYYRYLLRNGYYLTFDRFVERVMGRLSNLRGVLGYGTYLNYLKDKFPRLRAVLFEQLVAGEVTLSELLEPFGIELTTPFPRKNASPPDQDMVQQFVDNLGNPKRGSLMLPAGDLLGARRRFVDEAGLPSVDPGQLTELSASTRRMMEDFFSSENRTAGDVLGVRLDAYGYL